MSSKEDLFPELPGVDGFVRTVAGNIRALRRSAGMTLADLAATAGLGKSTLAQLESGRGNPRMETLWAIATALRVPLARIVEEERPALRVVRAAEVTPLLAEDSPGWVGRLLAAADRRGTFDVYGVDFAAAAIRRADAHEPGLIEHLIVVTGRLRAGPAATPVELGSGDLVSFAADVAHVYETLEPGHAVLIMAYP